MRLKKKIEEIHGKNTRKTKKLLKKLRREAAYLKKTIREKNEEKKNHLKKKYLEEEEKKKIVIPDTLKRYANLSIFKKRKEGESEAKDKTDIQKEKTLAIDAEIDDDEEAFLQLGPKFSIYRSLEQEDFETAFEVCNAKIRYDGMDKKDDDEEESEDMIATPEEQEKFDEMQAQSRQVYDPIEKKVNPSNRRVTDLRENTKVYLPKPLKPGEEAQLAIRKEKYMDTFKRYTEEKCSKKGEQIPNLTPQQKKGQKKLQKRIKDKEILVVPTDKTGKLIVASVEAYKKMGEAHTNKDIEIQWENVKEIQRQLNGHTSCWIKIGNMGENWNQVWRIRET